MMTTNNKSAPVPEMGERLATIDMGRKVEVLCPSLWAAGMLDSHLTQYRLKMHKTRFRLCPRPRLGLGSLKRTPDSLIS